MNGFTLATQATPDGTFMILEDEEHRVVSSGWTDDAAQLIARLPVRARPGDITTGASRWAERVDAYYSGELDGILNVPVRHFGTPLMQEGWRLLRGIRAGTVLTYTELAAAMGHPHAVRVAGGVCGRNAPALFVPCHRVRRSDGTLGGFAWGLPIKAALLRREGAVSDLPDSVEA
ncbi:methylated-DNA--[protein]-cysteine S-methyltransferase [Gryllotalpicola koreensis]|uniref:Methylated-DNA--[protein]-cysteine S-methyltransferase n=1 Tax=Gryllotalpicola koreensis TaxID=993086 RepID=A0ABP7ZR77_9MICO